MRRASLFVTRAVTTRAAATRAAAALLVAALGFAGCASNGSGFGVDLNLTLDPSVSDTTLATIASVQVQVTGAASDALTLPGSTLASRQTSISYAPKATSGALTFDASAVDTSGMTVASGQANVTLESGKTVAVTLTLSAGGGGDMGACNGVSACAAGDGCCPSGCNVNTDSDCQPACGNGVVEGNEVCDDGNTMNGDGCDVTCKYTNAVTVVSGHAGGPGWIDDKADKARYAFPRGLASDGTVLYSVDAGGTVRKTDPATGVVTTIAGSPGASNALPLQDGVGSAAVFSSSPSDVEVLGGALYVTDGGAGFGRFALRKIDLATGAVTSGLATFPAPSGFNVGASLHGLATDGTLLYILYDTSSFLIFGGGTSTTLYSYNPSNGALTSLGSVNGYLGQDVTVVGGVPYVTGFITGLFLPPPPPSPVYKVTGGTFTALAGTNVRGNAITNVGGNLFIGAGNQIIPITNLATTPSQGAAAAGSSSNAAGYLDNASPAAALFNGINGLALIGTTTMYIADNNNHVLRAWQSTGPVSTVAGSAPLIAPAYGATSSYTVLGGGQGLVSDGTNLWLSQAPGAAAQPIRKIALADGSSSTIGAALPVSSMTLIGANLYGVLNDGTIHQIPTSGAADSLYAGQVATTSPPADGCRNASACSGALAVLFAVSIATDGTDLYFVDSARTIRKIDSASGAVTTIAGTANSVDIVDGMGAAAHFAGPRGLVFTGGALYTLDGDNGPAVVVRKVDVATGAVTTIAGQRGGAGATDGIGAAARFSSLNDLTTDGTSLFVTDATTAYQNPGDKSVPAIRQIVLATGAVSTMVGTRDTWSTVAGTGAQAIINDPTAITYDPTNHVLFFFDNAEGVVERIK